MTYRIVPLLIALAACVEPTYTPNPIAVDGAELDVDDIADAPGDSPVDASPDVVTCSSYLSDPTGVHVPACVTVPAGPMPPNGWPLVFAFHRMSGTSGEALSRAGLSTIATWAVVIQPDGLKNGNSQYYDTGPQCCDAAVHDPTHLRDLDWVVDLRHQEEAAILIDPTQEYALGLSNGGWMTEAFACYDPAIVAAVSESDSPPALCGRPIWLRKTHGTADGTAYFDDNDPTCIGGPPCRLNGNNNFTHYYSADDPAPYGCTSLTPTGVTKDYDASVAGSESVEFTAGGCAQGTEVDFLRMNGSLHSPGWKTLWATDTTAWLHAHHR